MIAASLQTGAKYYSPELRRAGFFVRLHNPADKSLDAEFAILKVGDNAFIWASIAGLEEIKEVA